MKKKSKFSKLATQLKKEGADDPKALAAWIGRKGVRSGTDARTVSGERDTAQAHITDLVAELGETRQRLQIIEERLSGAEKLSEAHRQRADNAEARAERAEDRADRAADYLRAVISAQAAPRRSWWRW